MKNYGILSLFVFFIANLGIAQQIDEQQIIGKWEIKTIHGLEEISKSNPEISKQAESIFLNSTFNFYENNKFFFDVNTEDQFIKNGYWEYHPTEKTYYIYEENSPIPKQRVLMWINPQIENNKVLFFVSESAIYFEVVKLE